MSLRDLSIGECLCALVSVVSDPVDRVAVDTPTNHRYLVNNTPPFQRGANSPVSPSNACNVNTETIATTTTTTVDDDDDDDELMCSITPSIPSTAPSHFIRYSGVTRDADDDSPCTYSPATTPTTMTHSPHSMEAPRPMSLHALGATPIKEEPSPPPLSPPPLDSINPTSRTGNSECGAVFPGVPEPPFVLDPQPIKTERGHLYR